MDCARNHEVFITIEAGSIGGFGSHVSYLLSCCLFDKGLKFRNMILPDRFIDQDTPESMYAAAGLNADDICNKIQTFYLIKIILKL